MKLLLNVIVTLIIMAGAVASAQTLQDEIRLKQYFEGKQVILKIDMPATKDGVNIYPDREQAMNYSEYATRLKRYGVSIRNGESIMVTKVKVKNKHIEFQLGGGGYGTIGDETSTGVSVPSVGKSSRERRLEEDLKTETDSRQKRRLREELDDLRRDREREDRRNQAIAAEAEEAKRARIEQKALQGGSRFNIKFDMNVNPSALTPQAIMRALEQFVDFSEIGDKYSTNWRTSGRKSTVYLKTGLSPAEVIAFLGEPEEKFERTEGETLVSTYVFLRKEGRVIEADFIGGALVRSRTLQREWPKTQAMTALN